MLFGGMDAVGIWARQMPKASIPPKSTQDSLVRDEVNLFGHGVVHADGGGTGVVKTPLKSLYAGIRRVVSGG